ncbi:glycerophosphodiester phosphodiesterase [Lusitaniella coriacea LEGE 07157]|uniref:Glycerophosphodiester phosphodiesterase n=1 Tax=Lusitaniella coriacea LEGE 07157 TaxID=945747 RepID=A0A8J7IXR9_9CYAN|nr:glycerophosphodiester phosphodiesterase family protein [Lusitaniella coriacea]MBE9118963.1 glycerophosphodiester phosphodiesterase [Lusitaniella coriacea LEGE 07157]
MDLEIVAHRGFSAIAPENTLAAFSAAVQHGANAIEFDVQLSADRVPAIIHDATVERTTDGVGNVNDCTLEQLKRLDAGLWFSDRFTGERIPTLQEGLDFLKDTDLKIYPEIKEADDWSDADIDRLIILLNDPRWRDRCTIASFSDDFLSRFRDRETMKRTQPLTLAYYPLSPSDYADKLRQLKSDSNAMLLSEYHLLLDNPALIEASQDRNIDVGAWTVDNQHDLEQLTRLGVKRIVTNCLFGSN